MRKNQIKLWMLRLLRFIVGGIFIYASLDKIAHPAQFAQAVYNYQILPGQLINLTALILPWLELTAGLCLFFAFLEIPSLVILNGLIVIFAVFVGLSLSRGLDIHCGCFTTDPSAKSDMAQVLVRDVILLAAGLTALTLRLNLARSLGKKSISAR
jgi:uncharacterized membrane protein YphA (DoxX/SURF4 family)